MKYFVGGLWLVLALVLSTGPARKFLAYAGSVLAFVHLCALLFGKLDVYWNRRPVEGGVPVGGFTVGIAVGLILGLLLGGMVSRNSVLYYSVQVVASGFLMFLPLFRL
jgi:hypothetical protein